MNKTVLTSRSGIRVTVKHDGKTWRIVSHIHGRIIRRASANPETALKIAKDLINDLNKGYDPQTTLTTAQRSEYFLAISKLDGVPLMEAIDYYLSFNTATEKQSIPDLAAKCLAGLTKAGRSTVHLTGLRRLFKGFSEYFKGPINAITIAQLETFLGTIPDPTTRTNYRRAMIQLWRYARTQGALPYGKPTAAEGTNPITLTLSDPVTFSTSEIESYLLAAHKHLPEVLPFLVIGSFCGLRTSEIKRLKWQDINLEQGHIRLSSSITKTRKRRVVPISANAREWLALCAKDPKESVLTIEPHNGIRDLRKLCSLEPLPRNGMRHTAATMLLALGYNPIMVAAGLGNSVEVLESAYKGLATAAEATEYFNLFPPEDV